MTLRYLFGPVTAEFADQNLDALRRAGKCLTFGFAPGVDIVITPHDTWEGILARVPAGWQPDFVALYLAYTHVPEGLWRAPVPLVGLACDWNLLWHYYRCCLPRVELAFTDPVGVDVCRRAGFNHVRSGCLYGLERAFVEPTPDVPRDVDILFVGNLHPAVQRERLAWLGRLARLADRWRVHIATNVFGEVHRALLRRARIVFNRSIRGECNRRAFEAAACGALVFNESGNREVPSYFRDQVECISYRDDNLEELLERYLTNESERSMLAAAGQVRALNCRFETLWDELVGQVATELPQLVHQAKARSIPISEPALLIRTWQRVGSTRGNPDPDLVSDLTSALAAQPTNAALANAVGVLQALEDAVVSATAGPPAERAGRYFHQAVKADPHQVMAALNLVEALVAMGQADLALQGAQRTLAQVQSEQEFPAGAMDLPSYPPAFDVFRVEWEQAAWSHAGDPLSEQKAKRELLRWRLHTLLGEISGELFHFQEAAITRPDLAATRAALGCALGRAGKPGAGIAHLRDAVACNPFDRAAARALFQALMEAGNSKAAASWAAERRRLQRACPQSVPPEAWYGEPQATAAAAAPPPKRTPTRVAWEGPLWDRHSLGLVNRELASRLLSRGWDLEPLARDHQPPRAIEERYAALVERLAAPLSAPANMRVCHQWPPSFKAPPSGHWVVMQHWEYGSVPVGWVGPLAGPVDEVWVSSRWVRQCFVKSGVPGDKVHVIPLGVDPTRFHPDVKPYPLPTKKRFKFLFVGGTIVRKGIDVLLDSYARVFTAADDVCLVVKDQGVGTFYRGQTAADRIARLRATPAAPEVEYLDGELADDTMPSLYAACDCLVQPYRGEGFGLPIAEAMACGLPVIVTAGGAADDFCDDSNSYRIRSRLALLPDRRVGDMATVDFPWLLEPDPAALAELLRQVYTDPSAARARGLAAGAFVRGHLTWEQTTSAVEERLVALSERPVKRFTAMNISAMAAAGVAEADGRSRVTLTMIVRNEEHNLPECLASAADLFEEVVVVDTGSTDRTKEIARQFGARVFDFPWCDSFAAARNEALRYATGDWIFWLDADDRLDEANREKLRGLLADLRNDNFAYCVKCLCVPDAASGTSTLVDHIRLFRNHPGIRWRYRVHEQILPAVRDQGGEVRWADVVVRHTGYRDPALRGRKLERDLRLLRLEDADRPDDPFTMFNLGSVYQELGRHAEALPLLRRSLERSHPKDSIVRKLYALIAGCHRQLHQTSQALAVCREGLVACPDDAELLFVGGMLCREGGDLAGAEAALTSLLHAKQGEHFASVDAGLRGYKARNNLAIICQEGGREAEAEAHWQAALAERPEFQPARIGLGELYLKQNRWRDLEKLARQLETAAHAPAEAAVFRARVHLARKDFDLAQALLRPVITAAPQALWPRVVLSHVLLQQGTDMNAAEQALRAVLAIDPAHGEARNNLAVLLRNRSAATANQVFAAGSAPNAAVAQDDVFVVQADSETSGRSNPNSSSDDTGP